MAGSSRRIVVKRASSQELVAGGCDVSLIGT
jgi:hypothetical protein